jgi:hypothetical protein
MKIDELETRVRDFCENYQIGKEGQPIPLGFIAEMAFCFGIEIGFTLHEKEEST